MIIQEGDKLAAYKPFFPAGMPEALRKQRVSWGELYCSLNKTQTNNFTESKIVSFNASQEFCRSQGKALTDSILASKEVVKIALKLNDGRLQLKDKSLKGASLIVMPYVNNDTIYGYVQTSISSPRNFLKEKSIAFDSTDRHFSASSYAGSSVTEKKSLDSLPHDFFYGVTPQGEKFRMLTPGDYILFHSCKDGGSLLEK